MSCKIIVARFFSSAWSFHVREIDIIMSLTLARFTSAASATAMSANLSTPPPRARLPHGLFRLFDLQSPLQFELGSPMVVGGKSAAIEESHDEASMENPMRTHGAVSALASAQSATSSRLWWRDDLAAFSEARTPASAFPSALTRQWSREDLEAFTPVQLRQRLSEWCDALITHRGDEIDTLIWLHELVKTSHELADFARSPAQHIIMPGAHDLDQSQRHGTIRSLNEHRHGERRYDNVRSFDELSISPVPSGADTSISSDASGKSMMSHASESSISTTTERAEQYEATSRLQPLGPELAAAAPPIREPIDIDTAEMQAMRTDIARLQRELTRAQFEIAQYRVRSSKRQRHNHPHCTRLIHALLFQTLIRRR